MEYNVSVANPMLMGAIELMKAENTPEHRKMVADEIAKAKYLSPAKVTPVPGLGETKINPGSQIHLPVLAAPDGKQYFMAFTDLSELRKWRDEEGQQTVAMSFDDYALMMFRKDSQGNRSMAAGIVINPFGANIVVSNNAIAQYIASKAKEN